MHENTRPIPQKGQGTPVKVSKGHPFTELMPNN